MKRLMSAAVLLSLGTLGCQPELEEPALAQREELGQGSQDIIGGWEAWEGQIPWQARITVDGSHNCGGSLIHPSWVVTAAHCVDGLSTSQLRVIMGDHRIGRTEATEQSRPVKRYIKHPSFRYVSGAPVDDIALIEVSTPYTITPAVQTLKLPAASTSGSVHHVSGWGWTAPNGWWPSDTLQMAMVQEVSNSNCNAAPLVRDLYSTELCAGYSDGHTGACHGDSGGPLATRYSGELVGVVSWGTPRSCDSYTVFTRVSSYAAWLKSTVGVPLQRSVSMSWGGNLVLGGTIQLKCSSTGETVTGPTNVRGVHISLECPNATVTATCSDGGHANRNVDGFSRTVNGVTTSLPYGSSIATDSLYVRSGDKVHYGCSLTD